MLRAHFSTVSISSWLHIAPALTARPAAYHDVHGKNDSPLLTCALFAKCHKIVDANNYGQQDQLNTSVLNFIRDSAGYCAK